MGKLIIDDTIFLNGIPSDSGVAPGENPSIGIPGTYAEQETLRSANGLTAGLYYTITDYQTRFDAGEGVVVSGSVEPLTARAVADDRFDIVAYSPLFPEHEIDYDFSDTHITEYTYGEQEDGADLGGLGTISNITATSFQVNQILVVGADFNLYVEDDTNGDYEYYASDEGVKFTITDIGGGSSRIDLIDTATDPIDLTDAAYNYIFFEALNSVATRKGYIIRRKERKQNIECSFDFLNMVRLRKRINSGSYASWNGATVYSLDDLIERNGGLYKKIETRDGTTSAPYSSSPQWTMLSNSIVNDYVFKAVSMAGVVLDLDPVYKLVPTFSVWNGTDFIFSLLGVKNVLIESEDVVFSRGDSYSENKNVKVGSDCLGISFGGEVKNIEILSGSYNIATCLNSTVHNGKVPSKLSEVIFSASLIVFDIPGLSRSVVSVGSGLTIGNNSSEISISNGNDVVIGDNCVRGRLGQSSFSKFGSASFDFYFKSSRSTDIKPRIRNVKSYSDIVENLTVGYSFKNIIIESGITIRNCTIGDDAGSTNGAFIKTINSNMNNTNIKQRFLYIGGLAHTLITPNFNNSSVGANFRQFNCAGNVAYCNFENNVYNITASDSLNGLDIGNNVSNISLNRIQGGEIGSLSSGITIESIVDGLIIGKGCSGVSILGLVLSLSSLEIKSGVSALTIPATATNFFNSTAKVIKRAEGGNIRMEYIDALNNIIIKDPTT